MNLSRTSLDMPLAALILSAALAGCVTINIYFPAAAAEKAADAIIDEVWQMKSSRSAGPAAPATEPATQPAQEKAP